MKYLVIIVVFLLNINQAGSKILPKWFEISFKSFGLDKKYFATSLIKPSFLQGDFNGDKSQDVAMIITDKQTKKKGILLLHQGTNQYYIFGAGKAFGNGSDDFKWMKSWSVYNKATCYQTLFNKESGDIVGSKKIKLTKPAIEVLDLETSGGLIYWNGSKYIWIQQGE